MHDILHVRHISKLPDHIRATAVEGSLESLCLVSEAIIDRTTKFPSQRSALHLLPVFYRHLDPSTIPAPEEIDAITSSRTHLYTLKYEAIACHCFLVAKLRTHPQVREISSAQRGLHSMFAQAWSSLTSALLPALITDFTLPEVFEEAVDGARSCLNRLAAAVLKQTTIVMMCAMKDEINVACILSTLQLLKPPHSPRRTEWVSILLRGGIISCLLSVLRTLIRATSKNTTLEAHVDNGAKEGFNNLIYYMTIPPGYPWTAEALQAGLLRDLVSYTIHGSAYPGPDYIANLIGPNVLPGTLSDETYMSGLLPLSLVSRAVIVATSKGLDESKTFANDPRFRKSPTFAAWQNLLESTKSRMKVVDGWESAGQPSFLVCDNMPCGKIERKSRFKRCSGCQSANYCSAECQSADWANGHREICDALCHDRASKLSFISLFKFLFVLKSRSSHNLGIYLYIGQPEIVNSRDRSFMRALLHHDYQRYLLDVSLREIRFMRDSPGQEYVVIFDYTQAGGRVDVKVDSKSAYFEGAGVLGAGLRVQLQRLTRSGGRMAIHFMHLVEGMKSKGRLIPLRAARSDFHDGLVEIAKSSPFGRRTREETLHDEHRVKALIRKTSQLPVIH
ncbi:MYND-type domain-containing protein [Favolaschia claudopus]|uniref:MYND-type domain-containing protein n=1 Tax=Favolaschia claudopus TaxID=2862362 RepID=A0AAW0A2P2_9AGAR